MAIATSVLVSIAISVALSVGMKLLQSVLNPPRQQQSYGGQLQRHDPGTSVTVREPAAPQKIVFGTRRVAGTIVFAHTTQNNYLLHLVVAWAGHKVHGLGALYFGDEEVPLSGGIGQGKFYGKVGCDDNLGAADQSAFGNLIFHAPELWTVNHRGRGIACSYITIHWDRTLFGMFDPGKIWRVVEGMEVYDPREEELVFSDNVSLCVAAWMNSEKFGRGVPYAEINETELVASANVDDEEVTLKSGGTEKRYTCNAVLTADTPFVDNLNKLLSANHGECFPYGGQWVINSARWEEPTLTFGPGDFREPFTVVGGQGREGFNAIKGKFASPAKLWQPDDFPAIIVPEYEIEDGGDGQGAGRVFQDVYLEATTSSSMAQRIARIDLRAQRQPHAFTARLKLRGLKAVTGKNVAIDFPPLGWEAKPFRVKRLRIVPGFGPDGQPGVIGVDLDLVETAEYIYDWSAADEIVTDPAPNTTLPDPSNIVPATNLTATETLYATRTGGGVKAKVVLAWDASTDAFVQDGGWYVPEYRLSAASIWTKLPRVEDGATTAEILDIDPGTYDFRVWAFQYTGARSALAPTIVDRNIAGLAAIPATPVNLSSQVVGGGTLLELHWDESPDLDVQQGGKVVFRHAALTSGATWADGVSFGYPQPGNLTAALLPAKTGTIMMKFLDSSGNYSNGFASAVCNQGGMLDFSTLASVIESPSFAGTKVGVFVDETGALLIEGVDDFDAVPDVDSLVSWDYPAGVRVGDPYLLGEPDTGDVLGDPDTGDVLGKPETGSGYYDFAAPVDLGSVQHVRVTSLIETIVLNMLDDFDSRTTDSDDWPNWDGAVIGDEADAAMYARTTHDDPASPSAVWTDYNRLDAAEHHVRGIWPRYVPTTRDPNFNIKTTGLGVIVEAVT